AVRRPATIAHSLAIGTPADGNQALAIARDSAGAVESATDDEIIEAIRLVALTEGIFVEPAAGVTLAALARLARSGAIDRDATVVAYLTGNGFKAPEVALPARDAPISIAPTLAAFEAAEPQRGGQLVEV
ncbi:MAG: threonine synthase, partial [Candidatus Limnocylindria bacterium]